MLRNKELRRLALVMAGIAAAGTAVGFALGTAPGILALVLSAAFGLVLWLFTRARYQSLARISEEIDRVLHHADHLYISQSEEGELAILQSDIAKMTLRLRSQNDALRQEKTHLADSLADIAHQLRTPLTSANILLSLLESTPDGGQRKALLREAEGLFRQMDWLLTALLKLSRLDAGIVSFQREPIPVRHLLHTALSPLLIPLELHNIQTQISVPEDAVISGDLNWLSEALQNLLKNCLENAGDNGTITITCQDTLLFTELTMRDSGPGFTPEDLPHLFDRFYRGQGASAKGYGIGLALCRTILLGQGGTISAKNHPSGGALFILRFSK